MRTIAIAFTLAASVSTADAQTGLKQISPNMIVQMETGTESITPTRPFPSLPVAVAIHCMTSDQIDELTRVLVRRGDACRLFGHRWVAGILPELALTERSTLAYRHCELCGLSEGRKR